jgi:hypothetical protein
VVVDLDPGDVADRRAPDLAAPVGELLEAVLVVEVGLRSQVAFRASASAEAAEASMMLAPMYSPYASAGSISFVIFVSCPSELKTVFISSSASFFTLSMASRMLGPRLARRVCSTLTGCTVSPLTINAPCAKWSRASQRE